MRDEEYHDVGEPTIDPEEFLAQLKEEHLSLRSRSVHSALLTRFAADTYSSTSTATGCFRTPMMPERSVEGSRDVPWGCSAG